MANGKKYDLNITKNESDWTAQITRQVTSRKTKVTKEKDGFKTKAAAKKWAEKTLLEFTSTLSTSNDRHTAQRKNIEEVKRLRSNRRADKTQKAKDEKLNIQPSDTVTSEE